MRKASPTVWILLYTCIIFYTLLYVSGWPSDILPKLLLAAFSYFSAWGLYYFNAVKKVKKNMH